MPTPPCRAPLILLTTLLAATMACQEPAPIAKSPVPRSKSPSAKEETAAAPKAETAAAPASGEKVAGIQKVPSLTPLAGPHFPVFDLLDNRPLAHRWTRTSGGHVVTLDATKADFVRYINGNYPADWETNTSADEGQGAAVTGTKANLWFPAPEGARALALRVHNPAKGTNSLTLTLNGTALPPLPLEPGWQTVRTGEIAPGVLGLENAMVLTFANMGRYDKKLSGGMIAWVEAGVLPTKVPAATAPVFETVMAKEKDLVLGPGKGLVWTMWALPKSKLSVAYESKDADCVPHLRVLGTLGDGTAVVLTDQELKGSEASLQASVALGDLVKGERRVVRTELVAPQSCREALTLTMAQVLLPGQQPQRPQVKPPKHVVFWMIDTLRADHLPFYNPKTNVEAPELARLASEGAQFDLAYVQGNESKVSHASLFTGMFPSRHKVGAKGTLKPAQEIMPEAIKAAGYRTGAHISNGYISKPWGYQQGWDHFVNNLRDGWRIDGVAMAEHGIDWAKTQKDHPFFLYLGTIDPHVTYRRHEGLIEKYDTTPYNGRYQKYCSGEDLGRIKGGGLKPDDRDKTRIVNLYKNEITFNDQAFGTLRRAFEEMGIWQDTMVVVTADHGDEFWEHGGVGHGHSIHQELVHVPLLMYYPPLIKAGTRIEAGVDVLDVYPTLVDILGREPNDRIQGRSLVPLLLGQHGGYPQPATATRYLGHYGMQMQQYKLYLRSGDYHLYDRAHDPQELTNAKDTHPFESRWLLDSLGWFRSHRQEWEKKSWGVANNLSKDFVRLQDPQQ